MHKNRPLVTVIMPFNRLDDFFEMALGSITSQDYENLEILLLDNQPPPRQGHLLIHDPRVRVVNCRSYKSLSEVLNAGLGMAKGEYIARMDADDISHRDRIAVQVEYLINHQEIGIVGSGIEVISENEVRLEVLLQPSHHEEIVRKLIYKNPFFHPTVMFKKDVLANLPTLYKRYFTRSQDYELWTRLLFITRGANISRSLLSYRHHSLQSGKKIPNESLFFYRLAQLFLYLRQLKRRELQLSHAYGLFSAKETLTMGVKLIVSILRNHLNGFIQKIR